MLQEMEFVRRLMGRPEGQKILREAQQEQSKTAKEKQQKLAEYQAQLEKDLADLGAREAELWHGVRERDRQQRAAAAQLMDVRRQIAALQASPGPKISQLSAEFWAANESAFRDFKRKCLDEITHLDENRRELLKERTRTVTRMDREGHSRTWVEVEATNASKICDRICGLRDVIGPAEKLCRTLADPGPALQRLYDQLPLIELE